MLKLSASSMGTYEKCPKKYFYTYIEKPDIIKPDWSHLEFGKCGHRILELFHIELMQNQTNTTQYASLMRDCFKKGLSEFNIETLKDDLPLLKTVIQDYLSSLKITGLPEVVGVELNFTYEIGDYTVRGFIDRIDRIEDGHYKVVDYKTNKNPNYLTNFQLLLYAIAIKDLFPDCKKISGSYVLLKHKSSTKDWTFTDADLEKTKKKVLNFGESINTDAAWEKKPSMLCDWCDFKSICQDSWGDDD